MTITLPKHLTDHDLMAAAPRLAGDEREVAAQLVAHLAEIDARGLHVPAGYSSLYIYCREALGYSEDAAYNRRVAAQVARRYPAVIDMLASGRLSLTTVKMLVPVLNDTNSDSVLAEASGLAKREVERLVARLDPKPDVPSTIRQLPQPKAAVPERRLDGAERPGEPDGPVAPGRPDGWDRPGVPTSGGAAAGGSAASQAGAERPAAGEADSHRPERPARPLPAPRPIVAPLSPERYRVQFTIGEETEKKLRRLQQLLRREIPSGDPAVIFDKALDLLLARIESRKEGTASRAKPARADAAAGQAGVTGERARKARLLAPGSRRVPASTRRTVVPRDGGQCTFVAADGRRCTARVYLEYHHAGVPFARGGGPGAENISLHCRPHNAWEGRRVFGDHLPREVREARVQYDAMLANAIRTAVPERRLVS